MADQLLHIINHNTKEQKAITPGDKLWLAILHTPMTVQGAWFSKGSVERDHRGRRISNTSAYQQRTRELIRQAMTDKTKTD